jgi:hypothetical protein
MALLSLISRAISKLNTDGHIAVGLFVFAAGAAIHIFHGLDASFVAFTTTVFGYLGGHAYIQSQAQGAPNDSASTSTPAASTDK